MLNTIAIISAVLLVGAAIVQWSIAIYFKSFFRQKKLIRLPEAQQEKAVVVMSVRGCDPSLKGSLIGILNQNYRHYQVHLVVDNQTDQAWEFVHAIKAQHDPDDVLTIHEMQNPRETCSLKCHAIVQALEQISADTKYIALLDADVTPHANWLAELTGPLLDDSIGAVTGNQWFEPESPAGIGSLARCGWYGGAMVPTILFSNPWAGSFAMRAEDVKKSGLTEIWSRSVVDDGPIRKAINEIGLKIHVAPSLIMVNRESCTFSYANHWVTRLLTWSRLYESTFFLSVIHAAFSNTVMIANFLVLLVAIFNVNAAAIAISAFALISSGLMCVGAYLAARKCVSQSCQMRNDSLPPITVSRLFGILLVVPLGHLIYGISCLRAMLSKRIKWREITYELKSKGEVRRLNYQPYISGASETNSKVSI